MVKRAKYGNNVAIARRLRVSEAAVRVVRSRMRRGENNFYSATNKRIHRAILKELEAEES